MGKPRSLLVALALLRPEYWLDRIVSPNDSFKCKRPVRIAKGLAEENKFRLVIANPDFDDPDEIYQRAIIIIWSARQTGWLV